MAVLEPPPKRETPAAIAPTTASARTGEILTAPFEEDDLVEKDALLYKLDSSDAQELSLIHI